VRFVQVFEGGTVGQPPASVLDALACPDDTAAYLAMTAPGPDAAGPLAALEPQRLTQPGRVDALVVIEQQMAWLAGVQQRMLASMTAHDAAQSDDRWVREDVACALRLSAITAQRRIAVAQTLTASLPATLALLESGAISSLHAMNLAEAVYPLDAKTTATVEERVLARAGEQTLSQFKTSVRRAVASATPADDPRTADQRHADALVDLGVAALHDPLLPRAQGIRPTVQVTVALSTLLGCHEQPGELAAHGPIPAPIARHIAADPTGTWRRLITDPTGALLDHSTTTYRPPANLTALIIARDQTCTFPGCQRAAHRCDLDHEVPASTGGATNADNLAALRLSHESGLSDDRCK
jgi:hypothetical protein